MVYRTCRSATSALSDAMVSLALSNIATLICSQAAQPVKKACQTLLAMLALLRFSSADECRHRLEECKLLHAAKTGAITHVRL